MILFADTPAEWLASHLYGQFADHEDETIGARRLLGVADLVADDAAELRALHRQLVDDGAPPRAAVKYLSSWFGGIVGGAIAYACVASGAGFQIERSRVRWRLHPGGWADSVELGDTVALVAQDHAWSGLPGTETVGHADERHRRTVNALSRELEPLTAALAQLTSVGRPGIWAEIADGLGEALVYQTTVRVTEDGVATIRALVGAEGTPWKAQPSVWPVETSFGTLCMMQKGGCCLAYTAPVSEGHEDDDDHRLFRERFPSAPDAPPYCANCSLRPRDECEAHQLWWREREHLHRLEAGAS